MRHEIKKPDTKELRHFGLLTGAIAVCLFGLMLPWFAEYSYPKWPWVVAGVLWVWALILPASLWPVFRGWMIVGNVLGWINTRIILGLLFYIMFMPIGFIMKSLGKDPMARSIDKSRSTYRTPSPVLNKDHVERPF